MKSENPHPRKKPARCSKITETITTPNSPERMPTDPLEAPTADDLIRTIFSENTLQNNQEQTQILYHTYRARTQNKIFNSGQEQTCLQEVMMLAPQQGEHMG